MQKKFALTLISVSLALLSSSAQAINVCPFTDHFVIKAPVDLHVIRAVSDGNLAYNQVSYNYFRLGCMDVRSRDSGNVYMEIGLNDDMKCAVTLHDGPYEMNPTVTMVNCGGPASRIYYVGMEHTYGSYDYTLRFTM